ncbi:MAG: hypothetical protein ACFFFK_10420 [Candidatus Thorarchaeota archaeon]
MSRLVLNGITVSRTRLLTLSIIAVAYLLISTYQVLDYPFPAPAGQYEVSYTSTIPQSTNFTIQRESHVSTNSAVILNYTPFSGYEWLQIPRFDYDLVVFNVTLEPKNQQNDANYNVYFFASDGDIEITQQITSKTTLSVQTDLSAAKSGSDRWLLEVTVDISPREDFIFHSLIVWANSSVPLCPVSINLQSTSGQNLFENKYMQDMRHKSFLLASTNNLSSSHYRYYSQSVIDTLYLRPGSLNGTCSWGIYPYYGVDFNVSYHENEQVLLIIHMKTVEVKLFFDTSYPVHKIYWRVSDFDEIYDLQFAINSTPVILYTPPTNLWVSFSLGDPLTDNNYRLTSVAYMSGYLFINGSYNIQIDVHFKTALNLINTQDMIMGILSLSLFFLVILRIGLWVNNKLEFPKKRVIFDFRLIPLLAFTILAFIPWYFSTRVFQPYTQETPVLINSQLLGPIPVIGLWTQGSLLVLKVPEYALLWSFWSILLYWFPLILCITMCTTPSNLSSDIMMGIGLFSPAGYPFLLRILLSDVTNSILEITVIPLVGIVIPFAWLLLIGFLSFRGYYSHDRLQRDYDILPELEEIGQVESKDEPFFTPPLDLGFWLVMVFSFFAPCVIGFRHSGTSLSPTSIIPVSPVQALVYLVDSYGFYSSLNLAGLTIGIPYAVFTSLGFVWLLERRIHRRSMVWVLTALAASVLSMIPGVLLLNWIGWVRLNSPYILWYTWLPIPVMTLILLGLALVTWLGDAQSKTDVS